MSMTSMPRERYRWTSSVPFLLLQLSLLVPIFTGVTWQMVVLCLVSYYLRMFGVTAGYHRYFSHRAYKTGRIFQFLLAFLAQTSAQKGALWWTSHHRHHHRYSDEVEDVHSPRHRGFWYSHIGWILSTRWEKTDFDRVKDLAKYPELRFLSKHHLLPPVLYAAAMLALFGGQGLLWGFFISTTLLYHGTFTINSLAHVFGRSRYPTGDTSRNSMLLALVTMGEGWHNNHHHYQSSANQGWRWYEIDMSYMILRALAKVGLVWDLRIPPKHVVAGTRAPRNLPQADAKPAVIIQNVA